MVLPLVGPLNVFGNQNVSLTWDPNTESDLAGYRLYFGTTSGNYTSIVEVVAPVTTATASNLLSGQTYFFAVTAFNTSQIESDFSQEISYSLAADSVPVALAANFTTMEDQAISIPLTGSDANRDPLTFSITGLPTNGTLTGTAPNLTYLPNKDFFGTDGFSFNVSDALATSGPATVSITVLSVNDPPTLNALANIVRAQNAGVQTVTLAGISTGASNEGQNLVVTAISSNPSLVPTPTVSYVSPDTAGTLTLTPASNQSGTATITVTVNDTQPNSVISRTFSVIVNNPPTLNPLPNLTVDEGAPAQTVVLSGITTGAANETQTLNVTVTSSNPALIPTPTVSYTSPSSTGTLSFKPVANAFGAATITVTVGDGQAGNNVIKRAFTVTVNPINNPPTLNALANIVLAENPGLRTVALSGITSGATNESQTLTVAATSSNPTLVPTPTVSYTSPNTSGTLSFVPASNQCGTATITVTVNNGGPSDNIVSQSFSVIVNNPPTLNSLPSIIVDEDCGVQTVALTGINSGASNEAQTLRVTATSSNPALISTPTINYTSPNTSGTLTFTPVTNAFGTDTITVTVSDGQAGNSSMSRSFVVTVKPVNDAPTIDQPSTIIALPQNAGPQTISLSGITSGASNELQTLTVTATSTNPGLIPAPTINYTSPNTTGTLTFTPAANQWGTAVIALSVDDGQSTNHSFDAGFAVIINNPPTLDPIGNVTVDEDAAARTVSLSGISSGAANEAQTLWVSASSSNPDLIPTPTVNYASPNSSGTLTFKPIPNAFGTAILTVSVSDLQAANNTTNRSFTVTVNPVNPVNNPPTLNPLSSIVLKQNAALCTVPLSGITSGATNDIQTLAITATSSNLTLIPTPAISYTAPNTTGTLSFTPAANQWGTATVTVAVNDGQSSNNIVSRPLSVIVNNPPTLNALSDITLDQNSPLQTISLSGINSGAANELQFLTVTASSSNPDLIPTPSINYRSRNATGSISFAPTPNQSGTATITLTVNDGQAGNNTATRSFKVTVRAGPVISSLLVAANDARTLTLSWSTDKPATCFAEYGATSALGSLTGQTFGTNHWVSLTNLQPASVYYVKVHAVDASGNASSTDTATAATPSIALITWSAENGLVTQPMVVGTSSAAQNGNYISSPVLNSGSASFSLQLPAGSTYRLWTRAQAPSGGGSLYLSSDGDPESLLFIPETGWTNRWHWTQPVSIVPPNGSIPAIVEFDAGLHQIVFRGGNANTLLDELALSNDPQWTPIIATSQPRLSATAGSATNIDLAWLDNSGNATSIGIEWSTDGINFIPLAAVDSTNTSYHVANLSSQNQYYFRIYASNQVDRTAYSTVASARPANAQSPSSPNAVNAVVEQAARIRITWADTSTSETGFVLERSTDGVTFSPVQSPGINTTSAIDVPPVPGRLYYRVRAINAAGSSSPSPVATVLF